MVFNFGDHIYQRYNVSLPLRISPFKVLVGLYQPHENKTYYDFAGSGWICMYGHEVIIKNNLGCAILGVNVPNYSVVRI